MVHKDSSKSLLCFFYTVCPLSAQGGVPIFSSLYYMLKHETNFFFVLYPNRVWQHVVCMGLDKNNIPDEYLCEVCKPRPIDRKRAKAMQARRRNEIRELNNSSSSDGEHADKRRHPKKPKFGQKTPNASSSAAAATTAKEGKLNLN